MDRFRQAYELKSLVCAELDGDKKTLYALARTCRDFLDPSLDYLWHTIESFDPLLGCLPSGILREETQKTIFTNEPTVVFPNMAIRPKDLDRYLSYYARRIRNFHYWIKRNTKILSREMLSSLQVASGEKCGALAPVLNAFTWCPNVSHRDRLWSKKVQDQVPFVLALFVGDTVTILDLIVTDYAASPSIRVAQNRLPHLQSLALGVPEGFTVQDELITANDSLANLTSLSLVGDLSFSVPDLASLPRLSRLQLYDVQAPRMLDRAEEVAANSANFKALRRLYVSGFNFEEVADYFLFLPPSNGIHTVQCFTSDETSAEECYSAIHILQQHLNPRVLEILEMRDLQEDSSPLLLDLHEDPPPSVPGFEISPLFKFTKLKTLTVCVQPPVLVTEADIALIAEAWPDIQRLDLCGSWPIERAPSIDYCHLVQIAVSCKALRVLGVPFDGTGLLELSENSIRSHSVEVLRVCGSTIESDYDPESVDAIIRDCFPQLRRLDTSYQSWLTVSGPIDDRWHSVAEGLEAHIE